MFCAGDGSLPNSAAIFSIFFCAHSVLHTKISSENSCICRSVCSAQQASRQVGKQRIRRTGRGAWGADFILRPFAATKSASKSLPMRCCVSLLFVMFPAAVFFVILRPLCFSRISRSGEIRCALGNPSAVRNVPCAAIAISLHPGYGSALSNTALFHIVKLLREAS